MARDVQPVKACWFLRPLPMLPGGGSTYIGAAPTWTGWTLAIDRTTNEMLVCPPKGHAMGRIRVPMTNVAAYQLSSASVKLPEE